MIYTLFDWHRYNIFFALNVQFRIHFESNMLLLDCMLLFSSSGGAIFGLLGIHTSKFGRSPIIYLGLFVHMLSFYFIFLILPASSPIQEADELTYINPRSNENNCFVISLVCILQSNKCTQVINALNATAWGKQKETLMATYKTVVRPILMYASSIWSPLATLTNFKLHKTQH